MFDVAILGSLVVGVLAADLNQKSEPGSSSWSAVSTDMMLTFGTGSGDGLSNHSRDDCLAIARIKFEQEICEC